MEKQAVNFSSPLTTSDAVFLLFLGLRLAGYTDWSWWWVFAPIWGGAILRVIFEVATKGKQ